MKYVKPQVYVTEFTSNNAVAACSPSTSTNTPQQNISCVILSGEAHGVFYDYCASKAGDSGKLQEYNGKTYYVWYDGQVGGRPDANGEALIKGLGITGPGWHAGLATQEIISIVNAS